MMYRLIFLNKSEAILTKQSGMQTDPLPSWKEGPSKTSILRFLEAVTAEGSADFVPPLDRIAVFDNDGTLWSEKPFYFQLIFALERVKALAAAHPEWQDQQPYKAVLEGDIDGVLAGGLKALVEIVLATHAGTTSEEFEQIVLDWIGSARHSSTGRLYTEMVYQPMQELLETLQAYGFRNYVVSGGGIEFMRAWVEEVYGIPPEQVIGSSIETRFEVRDSGPVLVRLPKVDFVDDNEGKPVGIHKFIGRRPLLAFGNSDGDLQMLQWTAAGDGPRFLGLVHHTDAEREWAYDRESPVGRLDKALDEARERGWTLVDMAREWRVVYPWEASS
jgi:phosphoserine phosphatase